MAVSSQVRTPDTFGKVIVQHRQCAKPLKIPAVKPVFPTIDKRLVHKFLGRLYDTDRAALMAAMQIILG